MKTWIIAIGSIITGLALGSGTAFWSCHDPGPDFEWMYKSYPTTVAAVSGENVPETIEIVGSDDFDFGVMDRGETRSHTFVIRNNTSQLIIPKVVSTTCKCAVGELGHNEIAPGGEGEVTLEWVAKSLDTEFRQSATISTQNSVRPDIILSVHGRVIQMVSVVPRDIAFSDVSVRDGRSGEFTIYSYKEDQLTIVEGGWVHHDIAEFFDFDWRTVPSEIVSEEPDAKSAVICTVTMSPGLPLGPVHQILELKTSASDAGVVDVPIRAKIVGDVSVSGVRFRERTNSLQLGPVEQRQGAESKLYLTIKGEHAKDFEVSEIRVDPPDALRVELGEPRSMKQGKVVRVPIQVSIPRGAPIVNYSGGEQHPTGEVVLVTNHPDVKELSLRVVFAVVE